MSHNDIESSLATARTLIRGNSPLITKAASPYDMGLGGMFNDDGYGGEYNEDQYEHYKGRFYTAARLITSRLASQGVLVGRHNPESGERSVRSMIESGDLPPNAFPSWIGRPGSIEVLDPHPLLTALKDPNENHTQYNFMEMVAGSVMATGRSFIVALPAEGDRAKKRPWDLFAIPSTWMKPNHSGGMFSSWKIRPPRSTGSAITVGNDQVAHSYIADPSNPVGALSPMSMVAKSILSDEEISSAQYAEFKNGGIPKVALIAGDVMNETGFTDDPNRTSAARPVRLEPHQRRQLMTWFQQQYAGTRKSGLPIVLDAIIRDIKFLSRTPEEMAYLDSANLTKEQIFEAVGVSEILTGKLDGVTRASGSLAEQFFMDYCFNPILTMISQSITKKICPLFKMKDDEKLYSWIIPGVHRDAEMDIEYLRLGIRSYALTRNDVRKVISQRFGGIPQIEGMDDVIIPEKLEERLPEDDYLGVGRMSLEENMSE